MERLRAKTEARGLEIVALNGAKTREEVNAYLSKMKLHFPILLDPDGSNTWRWRVFALPTTFLLDTEGAHTQRAHPPTGWDEGEALEVTEAMLAELPGGQSSLNEPDNLSIVKGFY